jgi:hypothetical protein
VGDVIDEHRRTRVQRWSEEWVLFEVGVEGEIAVECSSEFIAFVFVSAIVLVEQFIGGMEMVWKWLSRLFIHSFIGLLTH